MSIRPPHMSTITASLHEFRKYLLPPTVRRIWFYVSVPVSTIHHVAHISEGRAPGAVPDDGGLGNAEFNAGRKVSKYGYEIRKLSKLAAPLSLADARRNLYLKAPPQKYNYAPTSLLSDFPLADMHVVLDRTKPQSAAKRPASKKRKPQTLYLGAHADSTEEAVLAAGYKGAFELEYAVSNVSRPPAKRLCSFSGARRAKGVGDDGGNENDARPANADVHAIDR